MTWTRPDLHNIFRLLTTRFGPQLWWPAETPFEVVIGAILTQNTAWSNVEKAIANLHAANLLTAEKIAGTSREELEQLIRPAGFFRQKAARLRQVTTILVDQYGGDVATFCAGPLDTARSRLLALPGIGPETADAILLYAAGRPSFVVDAYTRRIFARLGILASHENYETIRNRFMHELPPDPRLYNEYHALLVTLAKRHCRKRNPDCPTCPLADDCLFAGRGR